MARYTIRPARVSPALVHPHEERLAINDGWLFRLDPEDVGITKEWFKKFEGEWAGIRVPGSWQGQGFGTDANDAVWDF